MFNKKIELKEDLIDTGIAEKRLKNIKEGKSIIQTKEEFLKEMEDWVKE